MVKNDPSESTSLNSKILPKLPCLRVPYEESSVYSTYDPRTSSINDVGHIPPSHSFVLEEGDILFIPKHYWHFVETVTDLSLSVNLWLPYPLPQQPSFMPSIIIPEQTDTKEITAEEVNSKVKETSEEEKLKSEERKKVKEYLSTDTHSRLLEAATRFVFGALKGSIQNLFDTDDVTAGWINPSEQDGTLDSTWNVPSCSGKDIDGDSGEDDDDNKEEEGKGEEKGEEENMSVAKEINMPDGSKNEAAMRHLAYFANSLFDSRHALDDLDDVKYDDNEKSRKEHERSRRMKRGGYSSQEINGVDWKAEEDRNEAYKGMHGKCFEAFLKRFVSALLEQKRIEKCLHESL